MKSFYKVNNYVLILGLLSLSNLNFSMEKILSSSSNIESRTGDSIQDETEFSIDDSPDCIYLSETDDDEDTSDSDDLFFKQLKSAVISCNIEEAERLIKLNKIDLNQEFSNSTESIFDIALKSAVDGGQKKYSDATTQLNMVEFLLENGADINHISVFGKISLEMALSTNRPNPELIKLLLKRGAQIDDDILKLAKSKDNSAELSKILNSHLKKGTSNGKSKRCLLS